MRVVAHTIRPHPARFELDGEEVDPRRIRRGRGGTLLYHISDTACPIALQPVEVFQTVHHYTSTVQCERTQYRLR